MEAVKEVIDINAHVQNITCQISAGTGNAIAEIGFDNLGFGTITAIKFSAKAYNSFGDIILINGKEKFFLIIQDISIDRNTTAQNLKVNLPNPDIRKLELIEEQICYSDGSVAAYHGENLREFDLEKYDVSEVDKDIAAALKDKFGFEFKYKPKEFSDGWICGCGRFNKDRDTCSRCENTKENIFRCISDEEIENVILEHKKREEKREEEHQQEIKKKEQEKRKMKRYIGIGAVIIAFIAAFMVNANILSKRTTYSSKESMKSAMQGKWTHYIDVTDTESGIWQIIIDGDEMSRVYLASGKAPNVDTIKWNPSRGTFTNGKHTYIVNKDGTLTEKSTYSTYDYVKGGELGSSSSGSSTYSSDSSSYERGDIALQIKDVEVTHNGSFTVCTGTVKNYGSKTYKYVKIKGSFKDSSGDVVDTDWTYAVGFEGLGSKESTTFRLSVRENDEIRSCSVSLLDYD